MAALTAERLTEKRDGKRYVYPMAASKKIYQGSLVVLDASGNAEPGSTATGKIAVGMAVATVDNSSGSAGDKNVEIEAGVFKWDNAAGDALTAAEVGDTCYITDDQTVNKTATGKSAAGRLVALDSDGAWVKMEPPIASGLAAANNLSDVGTAATARANLGANLVALSMPDPAALDGTAVTRLVSPVAGDITKLHSVLSGALATGDATLTFSINGTPITSGVITIAESGSAAGDVDSATPSAANTVAVGDVIECTVGGTNTAAETAAVSLLIET